MGRIQGHRTVSRSGSHPWSTPARGDLPHATGVAAKKARLPRGTNQLFGDLARPQCTHLGLVLNFCSARPALP